MGWQEDYEKERRHRELVEATKQAQRPTVINQFFIVKGGGEEPDDYDDDDDDDDGDSDGCFNPGCGCLTFIIIIALLMYWGLIEF